jgi:hypothetical protein
MQGSRKVALGVGAKDRTISHEGGHYFETIQTQKR